MQKISYFNSVVDIVKINSFKDTISFDKVPKNLLRLLIEIIGSAIA